MNEGVNDEARESMERHFRGRRFTRGEEESYLQGYKDCHEMFMDANKVLQSLQARTGNSWTLGPSLREQMQEVRRQMYGMITHDAETKDEE
jgi:hypothetical protein